MNRENRKNILHQSFEIGILLKGINGAMEIIGGFLLLLMNPQRMNGLIFFLTQNELLDDPDDFIANKLLKFGETFSVSTQHFLMMYLLVHGVIKLFLVILLWRKKLWAYPLAIVSLILFCIYQLERFYHQPSAWLIALTVFDAIMIVLTAQEYKGMKEKNSKQR